MIRQNRILFIWWSVDGAQRVISTFIKVGGWGKHLSLDPKVRSEWDFSSVHYHAFPSHLVSHGLRRSMIRFLRQEVPYSGPNGQGMKT